MGAGASTAERDRCQLAFKWVKKLVKDGTGEGQPAHGFAMILADEATLFEKKPNGKPKLGTIMKPDLYDYRDKNLNLSDANAYDTLCNLAREDGAIIVDRRTGKILGGNYKIVDLSEAMDGMSGGTRHASASSCAQITGGFVVVASEAECKKLTKAEKVTVFYGNNKPREENVQDQVRGAVRRLSPYLARRLIVGVVRASPRAVVAAEPGVAALL